MRFAVALYDGHGNDYAAGAKCEIALIDILPDTIAGFKAMYQAAKETRNKHFPLSYPVLDEVRIMYDFRAFRDDGDPMYEFDTWEEHGWALVPDDFELEDEGRTELCTIAIDRVGVDGEFYLQAHCVPKHCDGWLRSRAFGEPQLNFTTSVFKAHGLRCPRCNDDEHIDVSAHVWVRLTPDGSTPDESHDRSHEWDDNSVVQCCLCGYRGTVFSFTPESRKKF